MYAELNENQAGLNRLVETYFTPEETLPAPQPSASLPRPIDLDDEALLEKAVKAKNGVQFQRLMDGDSTG